ncbi:MAG: hypothetical protein JSV91_01865 [Phycisphaerales bacterium]|nr:MAG: hypothetical protein JSV91_01865 [Phycisphaerales bacterium]
MRSTSPPPLARASAPEPAPTDEPPPVKRGPGRPIAIIAAAIVVAALLLVVVMSIEAPRGPEDALTDGDLSRLVGPGGLTDEELAREGPADPTLPGGGLPEAGWIQFTDPDDPQRLAQRYRFDRLDPNPEGRGVGWFEMVNPQIEIRLADDRLLSVTGRTALVSAPNQALEEGTISGDVVIRLFEGSADRAVDVRRDRPTFMIQTPEAYFDNFLGEVRCDQRLLMETESLEFPGRNLRMQINDLDQWATVSIETVEYIRLASQAARAEGDRLGELNRGANQRADRPRPGTGAANRREKAAGAESPPDRDLPASADELQHYRLTLNDNVRIVQGDDLTGRLITGDRLDIIFSAESGGFGLNFAAAEPASDPVITQGAPTAGFAAPPGPLPVAVSHLLLASLTQDEEARCQLAPPRSGNDTYIYCDGPLTVNPIRDRSRSLPALDDALLELTGRPVRLVDREAETEAECRRLRYHTLSRMTELVGSADHPLRVDGPDAEVRADAFWIRQSDNTGGFEGPGRLITYLAGQSEPTSRNGPAAEGTRPSNPLRVDWVRRVDLTFHEQSQEDMVSLGALRSADFIGEVTAVADEFDVSADRVGIDLPPDAESSGAIDAIRASGNVQVAGVGNAGSLACDELNLLLVRDDRARSLPQKLLASGNVHAENPQQSISADDLAVTFVPGGDGEESVVPRPDEILPGAGDVTMDTLKARGDVAVRLADGSRLLAESLDIDQTAGTMDLTGGNVSIASGRLLADRGRRISVRREQGLAVWEGAGRARVFPEPLGEDLTDLSGADELQITWINGVDFTLHQEGDEGNVRLRDATFNNGVDVQAADFWLDSDHLTLAFPSGEQDSARREIEIAEEIESIRAWDNVRVGSRHDRGTLSCDDLNLQMTRSLEGQSVPEKMTATGNIVASNLDRTAGTGQTVWAEYLDVTFRAEESGPSPETSGGDDESPRTVKAMVEQVIALRNVQVEMAEGGRAFADQLLGNAVDDLVELSGEEVLVVRDSLIIDRATRVALHGVDDTAHWKGPGRARVFDRSIEPVGEGRVVPPSVDETEEPQLFVTWTEQMVYDNTFNEGAGALDFRGEVEAMSRPSPLEVNTMSGEALTLQFVKTPDAATDDVIAPAQTNIGDLNGTERKLSTFIARGDAKLENRRWLNEDLSDTPSVFHVAGMHVEYDAVAVEAHVVGDGTLLIRDVTPEPAADLDAPDAISAIGRSSAPFGAKGITRFQWNRELRLTHAVDDRFDLYMDGDVRADHQALNGDVSTLRADRVDAVVIREEEADDLAVADLEERGDVFGVGGSMKLQRVAASGGVTILTPTRDVRCDAFDYNLLTNLAEISAVPGRRVSILTRGTARPIQAQRVLWYMAEDTIVITRGAGSGSR